MAASKCTNRVSIGFAGHRSVDTGLLDERRSTSLAVLPHYYCWLNTHSCTSFDSVQFTGGTMLVIGLIDEGLECVCRHPHFICFLVDFVVALQHGIIFFVVGVFFGELCLLCTWLAPVCGHLHVVVVSLSPALACLLYASLSYFVLFFCHLQHSFLAFRWQNSSSSFLTLP